MDRIGFIELLRQCLLDDLKYKHYSALIPWVIGSCFGIGFLIIYFFPIDHANSNNYLLLIAALIAAQGILLGMTTNAIQHIIQNVTSPGFSLFLKENNILNIYMFFIQYFQIIGILSLLSLISSALILISWLDLTIKNISFAISISLLLYSLKQTSDTAVLLRDLIHYRVIHDEHKAS